jgi:phage portal protein BeeE
MPIQSLISRSRETKLAPVLALSQPAERDLSFRFINGRLVTILDNKEQYLKQGYDINDVIYSCVELIRDKCRMAPWSMYTIKDEQAYKQYKGIIQKKDFTAMDWQMAAKYQRKALEPSANPGKWGELLTQPNEYCSWQDYVTECIGYMLLMGNNYEWANILGAGANKGVPNELWLLPSQFVNIFATDTFPTKVTKYEVALWPKVEYMPEEVNHQRTWNPHWEVNGTQLYGVAPLRAALGLTNRLNSSMDMTTEAFQNRGIDGILHLKAQPGNVDGEELVKEVATLKKTMLTEWVGVKNKGRMGISGYDIGWTPVGKDSEEMQIIASEVWSMRRMCNVFRLCSQLLNDPENKTFNSLEEAEKALTARAALPALIARRDSINRKGHKDWGMKEGEVADFDMTVFGELQADVKETAEWYKGLLVRIPNEERELVGLSAYDDETFNEPWVQVAGQWVPLSERQMNEVDNALNDDDEEEGV